MSEFQNFLNEQLQNDEFRKEWEDIQPEMDVIRTLTGERILKQSSFPCSEIPNDRF